MEKFGKYFNLTQEELNADDSLTKVVKSAVLRDILDGKLPERVTISGNLSFNLQKTEKIIWLFNNVKYYEERTRRQYQEVNQGFNIRIAKELYYRASSFNGHPVEKSEIVYIDTGVFGVTNKHVYFTGGNKSFRIQYNKIVSFTAFDDGIGIHRDAASAKPQIFATGDGWFSYNLLSNLAKL